MFQAPCQICGRAIHYLLQTAYWLQEPQTEGLDYVQFEGIGQKHFCRKMNLLSLGLSLKLPNPLQLATYSNDFFPQMLFICQETLVSRSIINFTAYAALKSFVMTIKCLRCYSLY